LWRYPFLGYKKTEWNSLVPIASVEEVKLGINAQNYANKTLLLLPISRQIRSDGKI
jgi:hypothetical protein